MQNFWIVGIGTVRTVAKWVAVEIDGVQYQGGYWIKNGEIFFHAFIRNDDNNG